MAAPASVIMPLDDIQSFADLDGAAGISPDGSPEPKYTTFWKFGDDGVAYFARIFKNMRDITIEEAISSLQRVPDEDIYPEVPPEAVAVFTIATRLGQPKDKLHVKGPSLFDYEGTDDLDGARTVFLDEAQILERIARTPHRNIVRYHGCQVRDGRLTGIVLGRHKCDVLEYFLQGRNLDAPLDTERFMAELESAVHHLHSGGLAHNDLKPANIMLSEDNMPVLIDFGSCRPFGERLMEAGTVGWHDPEKPMVASDKEHDVFSLGKIREWLFDPDRSLTG